MGFAETFKALSHPIRREILELLKSEPLSAGDIASHFDLTGATISHHLSVLKRLDWLLKGVKRILFIMSCVLLF